MIPYVLPSGLMVKNLPANVGDTRDLGSFPGSGGSLGAGKATTPIVSLVKSPGQRSLVGYSQSTG